MAASTHFLSLTPKTLSLHHSAAAAAAALFAPCSLKPLPRLALALSSVKYNAHSISRFVPKVSVSSELEEDLDGDEEDLEGDEGDDEPLNFSRAEERFPPEQKLFVGNLPFSVDSGTLAGLFEQIGGVEMIEVIMDKATGRSRGFAFVTMSSAENATAAAQQLNGYELEGRTIRVNNGPPPPKRENSSFRDGPRGGGGYGGGSGGYGGGGGGRTGSSDTNKLYVGNLSWDVDNGALENMFREKGRVTEAKVVYDRETGRSRGFGFVTYSSAEEVNSAIESFDGSELNGRSIRVNLAESRPPRQY